MQSRPSINLISVLVLLLPIQAMAITYSTATNEALDLTLIEAVQKDEQAEFLAKQKNTILVNSEEFKGVFEPVNNGGYQAVSMGLSPSWAKTASGEDKKRAGSEGICVRHCKKNNDYENDLDAIGKKYNKG